jgi:hypothetical protein
MPISNVIARPKSATDKHEEQAQDRLLNAAPDTPTKRSSSGGAVGGRFKVMAHVVMAAQRFQGERRGVKKVHATVSSWIHSQGYCSTADILPALLVVPLAASINPTYTYGHKKEEVR